jgi:hypothetical protein
MVDAQFADTFADRLGIADMPVGETIESRRNDSASPLILQTRSPFPERIRLFQLKHSDL